MLATVICATAIAVVAIAGSTVALCLGHLDAATYAALVGTIVGGGVGAGAHAAGVKTGGG